MVRRFFFFKSPERKGQVGIVDDDVVLLLCDDVFRVGFFF